MDDPDPVVELPEEAQLPTDGKVTEPVGISEGACDIYVAAVLMLTALDVEVVVEDIVRRRLYLPDYVQEIEVEAANPHVAHLEH